MTFEVRRAEEHVRRPWRNGGGMTAEVAAWPSDADAGSEFDWRVSFAEVAGSGDFSVFPGVDRVITLLDGPPMTLALPDTSVRLAPFRPFGFDGGVPIACTVDGPTRDLNVMTRRGRCTAAVEVIDLGAPRPVAAASPLVVLLLTGTAFASGGADLAELHAGDVLVTDRPLTLRGAGRCAIVRLAVVPGA